MLVEMCGNVGIRLEEEEEAEDQQGRFDPEPCRTRIAMLPEMMVMCIGTIRQYGGTANAIAAWAKELPSLLKV